MTLFSQCTGALTFETLFRVGRPPSFGTGGNVSIRAEVCVSLVLCVGGAMEKGRDEERGGLDGDIAHTHSSCASS
jgi:hypothetical protein